MMMRLRTFKGTHRFSLQTCMCHEFTGHPATWWTLSSFVKLKRLNQYFNKDFFFFFRELSFEFKILSFNGVEMFKFQVGKFEFRVEKFEF